MLQLLWTAVDWQGKNFIIISTDFRIFTKKFEELHEALYDANWWNLSQKNKKHFLIILDQLQTPVYIDSPLGNWSFSTMETVSCFVIIESFNTFFFISDVPVHLVILQHCHSSVQQMNFMSCSITIISITQDNQKIRHHTVFYHSQFHIKKCILVN